MSEKVKINIGLESYCVLQPAKQTYKNGSIDLSRNRYLAIANDIKIKSFHISDYVLKEIIPAILIYYILLDILRFGNIYVLYIYIFFCPLLYICRYLM